MRYLPWLDGLNQFSSRRRTKLVEGHRPRRKPAGCKLSVETLEDRCQPSFLAPVSYAVGSAPAAVATTDFNGDGRLDLVTANMGTYPENVGSVSVLLGNGDGTFQAARDFATSSGPRSVAVGDFNGDGKLDLATANQGNYPDYVGSVSALLGNGDGTFQASQTFATGAGPQSVAVGDFNGDGKLDLATANFGPVTDGYASDPGTVSILMGNGDSTFQAARDYAFPPQIGSIQHPLAVAAGDMNNDGKLDLVVTIDVSGYGDSGYVTVMLGNGDGIFTTARSTQVTIYGYSTGVTLGDFNGDGKLDVATIAGDGAVLLGNGDGTLKAPNTDISWGGSDLTVGDFNRDGKFDLVSDDYLLLGNGDGTFQPGVRYSLPGGSSVAVGDFNGDGFPDLAVPGFFNNVNNVSVSLNAASP